MTNRIAEHLPPEPPGDDFPGQHRGLRVVCLGVILFGVVVLTMASGVVWFGLGGQSLPKVGGEKVLTAVGAVLTLSAVAVAAAVVPLVTRSGVRAVATTPPDPPDEGAPLDTDADRLWRVYAQGKFIEYGLTEGAAVVTAVLFHLSADWLVLLFVGGMIAFQIARFPTEARAKAWLAAARVAVDRVRSERAD